MKTYYARSTNNRFYICLADSKMQMRKRGMNMKLDWQKIESLDKALGIALYEGI